MAKSLEQRVEELEDQVCALQQLLLAHVVALDGLDRITTNATCDIALTQLDAALDINRAGAAKRLAALVEAVQKCRD